MTPVPLHYVARYNRSSKELRLYTSDDQPTDLWTPVRDTDDAGAMLTAWGFRPATVWRMARNGTLVMPVRRMRALPDDEIDANDLQCWSCGVRHSEDATVDWRVDAYAVEYHENYRLWPKCETCEVESVQVVEANNRFAAAAGNGWAPPGDTHMPRPLATKIPPGVAL